MFLLLGELHLTINDGSSLQYALLDSYQYLAFGSGTGAPMCCLVRPHLTCGHLF